MAKFVMIAQMLAVMDAAALAVDTHRQLPQSTSLERTFQPSPPGIPQRRLSGGTRLQRQYIHYIVVDSH